MCRFIYNFFYRGSFIYTFMTQSHTRHDTYTICTTDSWLIMWFEGSAKIFLWTEFNCWKISSSASSYGMLLFHFPFWNRRQTNVHFLFLEQSSKFVIVWTIKWEITEWTCGLEWSWLHFNIYEYANKSCSFKMKLVTLQDIHTCPYIEIEKNWNRKIEIEKNAITFK